MSCDCVAVATFVIALRRGRRMTRVLDSGHAICWPSD
jgi:hypothetical protein